MKNKSNRAGAEIPRRKDIKMNKFKMMLQEATGKEIEEVKAEKGIGYKIVDPSRNVIPVMWESQIEASGAEKCLEAYLNALENAPTINMTIQDIAKRVDDIHLGVRHPRQDNIVTRTVCGVQMYAYIRLSEEATTKVTVDMLPLMNMSIDDLFDKAMENDEKEYKAFSLNEMMGIPGKGMTVVTRENNHRGASMMFNKRIHKKFEGMNIVIFPSSIHECLIIERSEDQDLDAFRDMVRAINDTAVAPEDRLSNEVYLLENGVLKIA